MKRVIKFRVWNNRDKKMLNVAGAEFISGREIMSAGTLLPDEVVYGKNNGGYFSPMMQYTGLHDKNGREIYDSDILKVTGEDGESYAATVKWFGDEDYPAFDLEGISAAWNYDANALATIFQSGVETCEVIGNIYDTPELMEASK